MPRHFPKFIELHAMLRGAAIGARMAVGPTRWVELRGFFDVAGPLFFAWLTLPLVMLAWPHIHLLAALVGG